jgi:hypothetical protein
VGEPVGIFTNATHTWVGYNFRKKTATLFTVR